MEGAPRYPWKIDVTDAMGRARTLGVGAEDGCVIFALLDHDANGRPDESKILGFSKAEPDAADQLAPVVQSACDRARVQARRPR